MRSVSKRFPDEFHGSITNTGRLASVRKRTITDIDGEDGLAGCRLVRTGRGRKRLICSNETSENHFEKSYDNFLFKNIRITMDG